MVRMPPAQPALHWAAGYFRARSKGTSRDIIQTLRLARELPERSWVMRVCLFEDADVTGLEPLVLTRPAFELLCGQDALRGKQLRYFAAQAVGVLIRPYLA